MKLGLVGRGRAARTLEPALRRSGADIRWWWSRGDERAPTTLGPVDVVLLAVSDGAIEAAAACLAQRDGARRETWLHLSGSRPGQVARVSPEVPEAAGCFHPLQALPGFEVPPEHLEGVVAGLDGDPDAVEAGRALAHRLAMRPVALAGDTKALYHAAAVSVAGHATALFSIAMATMAHAGFSESEARDALLPLMRGAVENLDDAMPSQVITGPIPRGDAATIAGHLGALDAVQPEAATLYRALGNHALALAKSSLSVEATDAVAKALKD